MKKSKLLMPLMGLTVLASVAPAMTLTSCNKNDNIFISSATVGNMYDQTKMLVTNRIGQESLYDAATGELKSNLDVKFALQLSSISSKMRTIRVSIEKQGTDTTTPFNVALNGFTYDVEAYTSVVTLDTAAAGINPIAINSTVIEQLAAEKKEATLKFVVKFEEITDAGKAINSQEIWFSLVACPTKHDLPTITPIQATEGQTHNFHGQNWTDESGGCIKFTGLQFSNIPVDTSFSIAYKNPSKLWMNKQTGDWNQIVVDNGLYGRGVKLEGTSIIFYGIPYNPVTTNDIFEDWYNWNLDFVCKETAGSNFVLPEWQCTGTILHKCGTDWVFEA